MNKTTVTARKWVKIGETEPVDLTLIFEDGCLSVPDVSPKLYGGLKPAAYDGLRKYGWVLRYDTPNSPRIDIESTEMARALDVLGLGRRGDES